MAEEWALRGDDPQAAGVDSVAALRALDAEYRSGSVELKGYASVGDGGGGLFYWDDIAAKAFTATAINDTFASTAHGFKLGHSVRLYGASLPTGVDAATNYYVTAVTANTFQLATSLANALTSTPVVVNLTADGSGSTNLADDGGTVIVPGTNPTSGRWMRRDTSFLNAEAFGARGDGTTNDYAAIQAAIDRGGEIRFAKRTYKCNSGLTVYVERTSLVAPGGATLDFSALASGYAVNFGSLLADFNAGPLEQSLRRVDGIKFLGGDITGVTGSNIEVASGPIRAAHYPFYNCSWDNFKVNFRYGAWAWGTRFINCNFRSGGAGGLNFHAPAAANEAERITFIGCVLYNSIESVRIESGSVSAFFIGCSFDQTNRMLTITNGAAYLVGCHIENAYDNDNWFYLSGGDSHLKITNSFIRAAGTHTTHDIAYSDSTATLLGIEIDNCFLSLTDTYNRPTIVGGTGRAIVEGTPPGYPTGLVKRPSSNFQNALANGSFSSAAALSEWILYGAVPPTYQTATYFSSPGAMQFVVNAAGQDSTAATPRFRLKGRQPPLISCRINCSGLCASAHFYLDLAYFNRAGAEISRLYLANYTTNTTGWEIAAPNPQASPPADAYSFQYFFNTAGWPSATPRVWLDDVVITGHDGQAELERLVTLTADVVNSNVAANTFTDVTGLSFPVLTGVTYRFRAVVAFDAAATTTGSRWSISGPASPTLLAYKALWPTDAAAEAFTYANTYDAGTVSASSAFTTGNVAIIEGIIRPSSGGTVVVRFASEVTASAITAKAGSSLQWW